MAFVSSRLLILTFLTALLLSGCGDDDSSDSTDSGDNIVWSSDDPLVNPGIGFTDFHTYRVHDDPYWNIPSYPETSVMYYRFYWEDIEPEQGVFNTDELDELFAQAKLLDKKVVLRFMTLESSYTDIVGTPCWVKVEVDSDPSNDLSDICTMDSTTAKEMYRNPLFLDMADQFLREMGSRYDSKEELLRIDVGMVGSWGEWHLDGWGLGNPNLGHADIGLTSADLKPYVDMVDAAFPTTPKTMLIGSKLEDMLGYATSIGMGWRADCLGDWNEGWNHMQNGYPESMEHAKGEGNVSNAYANPNFDDTWKTAAVDFEICGDGMADWLDEQSYEQVEQSFQWALEQHVSLINAKSKEIPEEYQELVRGVLNKMGYHLEFVELNIDSVMNAGEQYTISSQWQNTGVAPSYLNYPLAYRLRDDSDNVVATFVTVTDITEWLPSEELDGIPPVYTEVSDITIPATLNAGEYTLDIGFVDSESEAKILLENREARPDRWHEVTRITVR